MPEKSQPRIRITARVVVWHQVDLRGWIFNWELTIRVEIFEERRCGESEESAGNLSGKGRSMEMTNFFPMTL